MTPNARIAVPRMSASPALVLLLGLAAALPLGAQQAVPADDSQPVSVQSQSAAPASTATAYREEKEGFWGRVNPFARKKWVNKRVDPLKDRLSELDEINAKNARDIQDVDSRAQAGVRRAQSTADAAGQRADAANQQAQQANDRAQAATGRVNRLGETVDGLDQYRQVSELNLAFANGSTTLSASARRQLDRLAEGLVDRKGYIVELEGRALGAGGQGIQNSAKLNEAVKRYLVTEHQIPVYRLHTVALGQTRYAGGSKAHAAAANAVHVRLMENTLAAQGDTSPQINVSSNGVARPLASPAAPPSR